jgi:SAM-dependent methyltransferase
VPALRHADDADPNPADPNPAAVWDRIAPWWADRIGEGNDFQLRLIMPATDRLLGPRPGLRVLDACCGNGNYARRLGRAGCRCWRSTRPRRSSPTPAGGRPRPTATSTTAPATPTDEPAVRALGDPGGFDAAVCSMAVMDLPTIDPLFRAVRALLAPGGRFVFSVSHPCFNSNRARMTAELVNEGGRVAQVHGVHVTEYARETVDLSSGILNQPEPHYTYHRPLNVLFARAFAAGFVVDGFEEPAYPPGVGAKSAFSWAKRPDIPPACVVRLRTGG